MDTGIMNDNFLAFGPRASLLFNPRQCLQSSSNTGTFFCSRAYLSNRVQTCCWLGCCQHQMCPSSEGPCHVSQIGELSCKQVHTQHRHSAVEARVIQVDARKQYQIAALIWYTPHEA